MVGYANVSTAGGIDLQESIYTSMTKDTGSCGSAEDMEMPSRLLLVLRRPPSEGWTGSGEGSRTR